MLKGSKNMHQLWQKQELSHYFWVKLQSNLRCFLKNLHDWQEFYTTAGHTGRAKYQLWSIFVYLYILFAHFRSCGWGALCVVACFGHLYICDFVCLYIFTQFRSCGGGGHWALLRAQEEAVFCFPKLHNYELTTIQT